MKARWTFRGSAYCQLIRDSNKEKLLEWAKENLDTALNNCFTGIIWTDECSIQLETHCRFCCSKQGVQARPKPMFVNNWLTVFIVKIALCFFLVS